MIANRYRGPQNCRATYGQVQLKSSPTGVRQKIAVPRVFIVFWKRPFVRAARHWLPAGEEVDQRSGEA